MGWAVQNKVDVLMYIYTQWVHLKRRDANTGSSMVIISLFNSKGEEVAISDGVTSIICHEGLEAVA